MQLIINTTGKNGFYLQNGEWTAVTSYRSRDFKTLMGAVRWYERVTGDEVSIDTIKKMGSIS